MVRAIIFDFYSVWAPDVFQPYLDLAEQRGTPTYVEVNNLFNSYFQGLIDVPAVVGGLQEALGGTDTGSDLYALSQTTVSPAIVDFIRVLHGHFLKVGVIANLGQREYSILNSLNEQYQLFETVTCPFSLQSTNQLLTEDIFASALQAIGEPPQSCLAVSGNEKYLEYCKSIGMQVLPFEGFPNLQKSLADIIAGDMPTAVV